MEMEQSDVAAVDMRFNGRSASIELLCEIEADAVDGRGIVDDEGDGDINAGDAELNLDVVAVVFGRITIDAVIEVCCACFITLSLP